MFTPSGDGRTSELGLYAGGDRIGQMTMVLREGRWEGKPGPVWELSEDVRLRLSFRGDRFSVSTRQVSWISDDLTLLGGTGVLDFGAGSWETVVLKAGKGLYKRHQAAGGTPDRDSLRLPDGVLSSEVLPLYLSRAGMEPGEERRLRVFNMTLGQEFPLTLRYVGESGDGRLFEVAYWGFEERIWLDDRGMVAREEMALGVSARPPGDGAPVGHLPMESVLARTSVPGPGVPDDLGRREEAVMEMEGAFRPPPKGAWQSVRVEGDRTVVKLVRPRVPPAGQRLPEADAATGGEFGLDLDSPRIAELAREIAGPVEDPWEKALAIGRWVYSKLGKSMRECFTALKVLEAGEGECQSHSLLTVALVRSAGLPARFAYGVVYLPDSGAFGFHTWVEVHVGEWIPMDPTLGDFPAGVDHLTLAVGGYRDQFRLFPFIMGKGGWRIRMGQTESGSQ